MSKPISPRETIAIPMKTGGGSKVAVFGRGCSTLFSAFPLRAGLSDDFEVLRQLIRARSEESAGHAKMGIPTASFARHIRME